MTEPKAEPKSESPSESPFDQSRLYDPAHPPRVELHHGVAYVEHYAICLAHTTGIGANANPHSHPVPRPVLLRSALLQPSGKLTCPSCYGPARYATAEDLEHFRPITRLESAQSALKDGVPR